MLSIEGLADRLLYCDSEPHFWIFPQEIAVLIIFASMSVQLESQKVSRKRVSGLGIGKF